MSKSKPQLLIATIDTFTKTGKLVPRGTTVSSDEVDYDKKKSTNLVPAPAGTGEGAIEVSAIAPTGPNPVNPQQIAPSATQALGGYHDNGAQLVGEVTAPEKVRRAIIVDADDDTEAKLTETLADADAERAEREAKARAEAAEKDEEARAAAAS